VDRARVRHAAIGLATAAALLTAGAAWPLWVQLRGRGVVTGPVSNASTFGADLLGSVVPGSHQLLGRSSIESWAGGSTENGSYLGVPLLAFLLYGAWYFRRIAVVRFAGALAVVAFVLSLGSRLAIGGTTYDVPLPFTWIQRLPLLENMAPVRLSLYVVLLAAVLLAVGLDRLHAEGLLRPRRALPLSLAALVLLPLTPAWPYTFVPAGTPSYFTSSAVQRIPRDAVVLTYPVPRFPGSEPMQWQALAGYRYRSVGGYVITADERGNGTFLGARTTWERVVVEAGVGRGVQLYNPTTAMRLRVELDRLDVRAVLVADRPGSEAVIELVTLLFGRPGEHRGGVTAWYL
jgi:hypothetical protein